MTFVSLILVNECFLVDAKVNPNAKPSRFISGGIISGEWERLVGAVGMILWTCAFKAQLYMDNLSFSTALYSNEGK